MELKGFYGKYRKDGCGQAAYEPSMMVSLLLYAYCMGERSSRQIERLCEKDIAFRVITGNQKPDHRGDELPEELQGRKNRLARLKACQERLEREAQERAAYQEKKIEARKEEKAMGKKRRGRKPKEADSEPGGEAKANVTDPESRIMKTKKGYEQGYNGQAVTTKEQIIVAAQMTQEANDIKQLHPMIKETKKTLD